MSEVTSGIPCYLCGGTTFSAGITDPSFPELVECRWCGLGQWASIPTEQELSEFYAERYNQYLESEAAAFDRDPLSVVASAIGRIRTIEQVRDGHTVRSHLGVGTGYPILQAAVSRAGISAAGIEPNNDARRWGAERSVEMYPDAESVEGTYDWIDASHVIEHLPDPLQSLHHLGGILRPAGVLTGAVPNWSSVVSRVQRSQWEWFAYPAHLWYFTPISLCVLLGRAGLTLHSLWSDAAALEAEASGWLTEMGPDAMARSLAGPELKFIAMKAATPTTGDINRTS